MIDIKLSDDGGLDLGKPVDDIEQLKQGIKILLETQMGEFIEDKDMGLDTKDILGEKYNESVIKDAIQNALKTNSQINQFDDFKISIERKHRDVLVTLSLYISDDKSNYEELEVKINVK